MLTSGQLCVMVPHGLSDRRVEDTQKDRPIARCLFGRPDPLETRKLLEEEFASNRERMLSRWGVDIFTGQFVQSTVDDKTTAVISRPTPYTRQTRISDFWRSKKTSSLGKSMAAGTELRSGSAQTQK